MKKIIYFLSAFMLTLSMQSCFQEDKELFDRPTALRVEEAAQEIKSLLESSPNGWLLEYYTGKQYSGGGYNMLMNFKDGRVDVSSDIAPADSVSHSSWDIKKDQGIVISIDTYNEIFHAMSNPSSSAVDGQEADYEFVVLRQTQDSIYVRGKKFGNKMVLTRIADGTNWKDYIEKSRQVVDSIADYYKTKAGTEFHIDYANRRFYIGNDAVGKAFRAVPEGIIFQDTINIDGQTISSLNMNTKTCNMSNDVLGTINYEIKPLSNYLKDGTWYISTGKISPLVSSYCKYAAAGMKTRGFSFGYLSFGPIGNLWCINVGLLRNSDYNLFNAYYSYTMTGTNTIKLTNGTSDQYGNGDFVNENLGGEYMFGMFGTGSDSSTWKLTTDNTKRPTYIHWEDSSNPRRYFNVVRDMITFPFGE